MTGVFHAFDPLSFWWLPPAALVLDLAFGDPRLLPHPVQGVGFLANRLEDPARSLPFPVLAGGLVLVLVLCAAGGAAALLVSLPSFWGTAGALYAGWSALALGSLVREGRKALACIERGTLEEARSSVQMLVSRDVSTLERDGLYRTLAETLGENFNDAFVAPFFWLLCSGPAGVWVYKAASTMDSMWGYRNERWLLLGRVSARLDDVLAFIPARLSALLLCLTARLVPLPRHVPGPVGTARSFRQLWSVIRRDALRMQSPNAGWPMAASAWLHGARMGGPAVYHGKLVEKPRLGPESGAWDARTVESLLRHVRLAGICGGLVMWGVAAIVPRLWG